MNKILFTIATLLTLSTSVQAYDHFNRAKHPSMEACWNYVQIKIGNNYRIVTDKADKVEGLYGAKQDKMFACRIISSGTQGTYVESVLVATNRP